MTTFCFRQLRLLIHPARTVSRSGHQHQRRTSRPARVTPRHKDAAVGRPQMTLLVTAEGGLLERPRFSVPLIHRSRSVIAAVVAEPASYRSSVLALTGDILATWSTQHQRSACLNGLASVEMLRRAMRGRDGAAQSTYAYRCILLRDTTKMRDRWDHPSAGSDDEVNQLTGPAVRPAHGSGDGRADGGATAAPPRPTRSRPHPPAATPNRWRRHEKSRVRNGVYEPCAFWKAPSV